MNIPTRVQIIPLGYEKNRVLEPINRLMADKVILLRHLEEDDYEAEFQKELIETLTANDRLEVEERRCDLFSLDQSLIAIKDAILDCDADDQVYVNLSTGSKLTAIAGTMACQATGATPFYATPEFRTGEGEREPPSEPLVKSVGDITEIPRVPLQLPNEDQQRILAYIDELEDKDHVTKKELIRFSEREELSFIAETESKSEEGKYQLLETNIINPLKDDGYVEIEKRGREKHVKITDEGHDIVGISPV